MSVFGKFIVTPKVNSELEIVSNDVALRAKLPINLHSEEDMTYPTVDGLYGLFVKYNNIKKEQSISN